MAGADITIINRENLQWLIESSGFPFDYDMVVIDELSSFKNHNSRRFKSLLKVRPSVKRIIGLPGETIEIREGTVYIDGEPIAETYLTRVDDQSMDPITLAKDEIFVMGDNRPVSRDSRAVGPLTLDEIYGRVLFVAFPFNEIRSTMALPEY